MLVFSAMIILSFLVSMTSVQVACAADTPLMVGAASESILPPPGVRLGGYGMRYTPSTGVRSDIFARVITLQKGDARLVWIVCDLLCVEWKDTQTIQNKISQKYGIDAKRIIVSSTHTHSAPATASLGPPKEEGYVNDFLIPRVLKAVDRALASTEACSMVVVQGHCEVAHDRRNDPVKGDGGAPNPDKKLAYVDYRVPAIGFKRGDGTFKTILVQYAMHPTSWGDTNVGAEWPGAVAVALKKTFGDRVEPFVLQGGGGNLGSPKRRANPEEMQSWGDEIVASVAAKLKETPALKKSGFGFGYKNLSIAEAAGKTEEQIREDANKWRKTYSKNAQTLENVVDPWEKKQLARLRDGTIGSVPSNTAMVALGGHVFVTTPFETFSQLNREIARYVNCPVHVIGYTNGCWNYFPTLDAHRQGGYEPGSAAFWWGMYPCEPGSLEKFALEIAPFVMETLASEK